MIPSFGRRSPFYGAVNKAGAALRHAGFSPVHYEEDRLLAAARRRTGLSDFGDEAFREPLRRLLVSYRTEAKLTLIGQIVAQQNTISLLANRLRVIEDRRRNPGIAEQKIRKPLFIVGLPRTGTTLLHNLLAQDPDNRVPMTWEVMHPSPPPERASFSTDPRIEKTDRQTRWISRLSPGFDQIHPISATLPQECIGIHSFAFLSSQFQTMFWIPSFERWMDDQDLRPAYRWQRLFLQHLQWRCPARRWALKAPMHLFGLEALVQEFPDARIVQTHRDPLAVIGSVASLTAALQRAFSDHIDLRAIGAEASQRWHEGAERSVRFRAARSTPDEQFFDLYFSDLVRDPLAEVRRVYEHFDMELTELAQARMHAFLADDPRCVRGRHTYALEDFGIDAGEQFRKFRAYREYFGVEAELIPHEVHPKQPRDQSEAVESPKLDQTSITSAKPRG